ncbi:hypothetical protein M8J76_013486 [Diaphorina citri]|nr:hypothetical protein M8J76_013486 [Diaphorina citri]
MEPRYDVVQLLLETPFQRWKDKDQTDLLEQGRPEKILNLNVTKKKGKHSYQERLTSLANITIQKDILQDLMKGSLHSDIIELYATAKDRRIPLTYKK